MSKDRSHRARGTLLWALALFTAGQLIAVALLDYPFWRLRFPSAADALGRFEARPSADIVFLGSSRFGGGIKPAEIESLLTRTSPGVPCSVLNGAVVAGDAIASELVLGKLLRAGARPRLVVVEVMPENLNSYNEWQSMHVRRQYRWEDLPEHFREVCWSRQLGRFLSARVLALHMHRGQVRQALLRALRPNDQPAPPPPPPTPLSGPPDWEHLLRPPHRPMPPELTAILRTTDGPRRFLRWFALGGDCPASLERILALGEQQGFKVVLLAPAVTQVYRREYTLPIEAEFQRYIAGLRQRHGCSFVDARDWLDDSLFVDMHHHHHLGGLYLSRLFTYRVLAPWWRQEVGGANGLAARR
jgi:hypothetical protein